MTTPNAPFQTQYTDAVAWLEIYDANNDSFLKSLKSQLASKKRLSPKQVTWLLRKFNLVTQNTAPKSPLSDAPNNIADVTLRNAIVYFAMTYNGTFKFMVDMKARLLNNTGLTENQWNAVTKCYTRDAQYKAPLLVTPNIIAPAKYFAFANPVPVVLTRKGAMALKKKYNLTFGPFTVEILGAYDTVSRRGYRNYIMCVNVSGAVNVCRVCGKSLVDHKSVVSGIGPVCAKNLGAIYHTYKTDIQKFMADFATQCAVIGNMEIEFNSWSFKEGYQQMNMAFDAAKQSNNVITPSVAVNAAPPVPAPSPPTLANPSGCSFRIHCRRLDAGGTGDRATWLSLKMALAGGPMSYSKQTKPASPGKTNAVKETQALLQLLAMGGQQVAEGKVESFEYVAEELRAALKAGRLGS